VLQDALGGQGCWADVKHATMAATYIFLDKYTQPCRQGLHRKLK